MPQVRFGASFSARMFRRHTSAPVRAIEASQLAERPERVDPLVVIGRRRPRTVTTQAFDELALPAIRPELTAGFDVVRSHHLLLPALLDGERAAVGDDERRVAEPDWLPPQPRESFARPIRSDRRLEVSPVPVGSPEVGPVPARRRAGARSGRDGRGGNSAGGIPRCYRAGGMSGWTDPVDASAAAGSGR